MNNLICDLLIICFGEETKFPLREGLIHPPLPLITFLPTKSPGKLSDGGKVKVFAHSRRAAMPALGVAMTTAKSFLFRAASARRDGLGQIHE